VACTDVHSAGAHADGPAIHGRHHCVATSLLPVVSKAEIVVGTHIDCTNGLASGVESGIVVIAGTFHDVDARRGRRADGAIPAVLDSVHEVQHVKHIYIQCI
jgi:hypothetical protein